MIAVYGENNTLPVRLVVEIGRKPPEIFPKHCVEELGAEKGDNVTQREPVKRNHAPDLQDRWLGRSYGGESP